MSNISTDRAIQRTIAVRPETSNKITFSFSTSISAFTWMLIVRQFGAEVNKIELTESNGITKTATKLQVALPSLDNMSGEYFWYLYYAPYFLITGSFKVIRGVYTGDANAAQTATVNLNGTDATLTITPWLI